MRVTALQGSKLSCTSSQQYKWSGELFGKAKSSTRRPAIESAASKTPIIDALLKHSEREVSAFHVPGHKLGQGAHPAILQLIGEQVFQHDLTELPGLDNLANPQGPIAESLRLAAEVFGAERTWYLVNGATAGLQAAVMATCEPGSSLLIARNSHACCFSAMALADAHPIWVYPEQHPTADVAQCISPESLSSSFEAAMTDGLAPKAALIVSPTYFGACSDIRGLAGVCHRFGVPLIVDAAHGSHLGLHPGFPESALQQGADIAVYSCHKTLSSLGQSAMLHCQGPLVSHHKISQALRLLQTTSPSYLLLASLDAAQAQAREMSCGQLITPLSAIQDTRQALRELSGALLLQDCAAPGDSAKAYDPWRMTIVCGNHRGLEVEAELRTQHAVYSEMATSEVVVFALGSGTRRKDLRKLLEGVTAIFSKASWEMARMPVKENWATSDTSADTILSPREAFFAKKKMVKIETALGRVSGDIICPYPPGVPLVIPGESLSHTLLRALKEAVLTGRLITGATDPSLQRVSVIEV